MAINRVEIKDFLVFKGEFAADFCPGINVLIGGNGTGKTTLLKLMFWYAKYNKYIDWETNPENRSKFVGIEHIFGASPEQIRLHRRPQIDCQDDEKVIYIPEKDILEHAKGLLPFIEQKPTGFSWIYRDALIRAQDIPTKTQTDIQKEIGEKIASITGGYMEWVQSEGTFYTIRTDGMRIPFSIEASGFKKLGFLGLLVTSGQLEPGAILFWDEPENSLNPELVPILVDILLELSRNGVQIFLATHSEILASYFAVNRTNVDDVLFISLYKDNKRIKADSGCRFDLLDPNNLTAEPVKLYEKEIEKGLGGNG